MYLYISKSIIYNSDEKNLCIKIHIKDICIKCSIVLCMHEYVYMSIIYKEHHIYKSIIYNSDEKLMYKNTYKGHMHKMEHCLTHA